MAASGRQDYQNVPTVDIEDDELIDPDDADLNDFDDPLQTSTSATSSSRQQQPTPAVSGTIGSSTSSSRQQQSSSSSSFWTSRINIPGEDRRAPTNTIDESVWATLRRDLLAVWHKLREVLYPRHLFLFAGTGQNNNSNNNSASSSSGWRGTYARLGGVGREELAGLAGRVMDPESLLNHDYLGTSPELRDWDLWGPLVFCLLLSTLLSLKGREKQREQVFSGVFAIVWIGMAVVTLQIRLLGGNISFMQSICVIGYTLFPLVIAALLSALSTPWIARIPVYLVLVAWSLAAGVSILGGSGVVKNRVGLAVYPLFVFYLGLGCLCFIS